MGRDYGRLFSGYWTGQTGKQIRARGLAAQLLGTYLVSNDHANMIGLYYLPVPLIAHELGLPLEGARDALRSLAEVGFAHYDDDTEHVWVVEMARLQVKTPDEPPDAPLKPHDNRVKGVKRLYATLPNNPFLRPFFDKYGALFQLTEARGEPVQAPPPSKGAAPPLGSPLEGDSAPPSKPGSGSGSGSSASLSRGAALAVSTWGHCLVREAIPPLPADLDTLLTPERVAHAEVCHCGDPPLALRHWHGKRWARRDDTTTWKTDWLADFDTWLLDHDRFGCPCQATKRGPVGVRTKTAGNADAFRKFAAGGDAS